MVNQTKYRSLGEMKTAWAKAAAAKLRADGVDANDLAAARECLVACVGGVRLYDFWLAEYHPEVERETE